MTGEHSRHDELEQDDDFYVLGDDDTEVSSPREVAPPSAAPRQKAFTQTSAEEEDELFTPTEAQRAVGPESSFTERAGRNWGGSGLSAEDIGIPIERDEHGQTPTEPTLEEGAESTESPFAEEEKLEVIEVGSSSPRLVAVEPESDLGLVDDEQGGFHDADELAAAAAAPQSLHPRRKVHPTDTRAPARGEFAEDAEEVAAHIQDLAEQAPEADTSEEDASELGAEPTVFLDEAAETEELAAEGEEAPAEGDDAWAPIEAPTDPLAAGVEEEAPAEVAAEVAEPEEEFAEVAAGQEAFVDAGPEPEIIAGAGYDRPRRRGGWLAAAALVLAAGGGFFAYQRGWLTNPEPDQTIQRADVPRPRGFQAPEPPRKDPDPIVASQPSSLPVVTEPVVEPVKEPVKEPVAEPVKEPVVEPVKEPILEPVASQPTSRGEIAKLPDPEPKPEIPEPTKELGVVQIGEGLTMQEAPKEPLPKTPKESMRGLLPGSQAFAQLHNGNFFVGNVKALDAEFVTLRLEKGEVTLAVGELKTIVPLASSEYQELKRVDQGFVRLNNRNRLLGTILTTKDENIILENKANRVVIPKSAIEELGTVGRTNVRLADEDNSWVDRVIEKQLQDRGGKPEAQPNQDGGANTRSKDKQKVKSVIGDDAAARPK